MGQPKLLLRWGKASILSHLLSQWQQLGAKQLTVVCAADDDVINRELDQLGFPASQRILNPAPGRGMFSSLQCAARCRFIASLLQAGRIRAAPLPSLGQIAPKM